MKTTPPMTAPEKRDLRLWQIREVMGRIRPEDMTDAELEAAIAIFGLAEARLPGNRPILRIIPATEGTTPA